MIKDDLPRDDYREKKLQRLEEIKNERKEAGVGQLIFEKEMFNQFQAMTIADVWTFDTQEMTFHVSERINELYGLHKDQAVNSQTYNPLLSGKLNPLIANLSCLVFRKSKPTVPHHQP